LKLVQISSNFEEIILALKMLVSYLFIRIYGQWHCMKIE